VELPRESTSMRKLPGSVTVNASVGVATSYTWPRSSLRTRRFITPSVISNCAMRSSSARIWKLVVSPMRTEVLPTWSSARESRSAHRRSPRISGRFSSAPTHSSSPPGWKLTSPLATERRATRTGGSDSSS
jgi:hypothetical protein